jgi:hypothetical protein
MGQEVKVVYRTTSPRYVVERLWSDGWGADIWEADKGFVDLDDAKKYADEQQAIFPDGEFRVVDTQP